MDKTTTQDLAKAFLDRERALTAIQVTTPYELSLKTGKLAQLQRKFTNLPVTVQNEINRVRRTKKLSS